MRYSLFALLCLASCGSTADAKVGDTWELMEHTAEVDIYKRQLPTDKVPEIKGVGVLPGSPEKVLALITDIPRYAKLLSHLKTAEVLSSASGESVVYFYFDFPWPVSDRDYVVHYHWAAKGEGFVMDWTADNAQRPTSPEGVVRIETVRGSWSLMPRADGDTDATFIFLAEYGGELPAWMRKKAQAEEPKELFAALRKSLKP